MFVSGGAGKFQKLICGLKSALTYFIHIGAVGSYVQKATFFLGQSDDIKPKMIKDRDPTRKTGWTQGHRIRRL